MSDPRNVLRKEIMAGGPALDFFLAITEGNLRISEGFRSATKSGMKALTQTVGEGPISPFIGALESLILEIEADEFADNPEPIGIVGEPPALREFPMLGPAPLPQLLRASNGLRFRPSDIESFWRKGDGWLLSMNSGSYLTIPPEDGEALVSMFADRTTDLLVRGDR